MSADNHLPIPMHAPYQIRIEQTLPESEQHIIVSLLGLLSADCIQLNCNDIQNPSVIYIKDIVDGRGLACPMPLLKTKVALRNVTIGGSLYVVATDPNSQADITAFCQQTGRTSTVNTLLLLVNQKTDSVSIEGDDCDTTDTIYHFIITKTGSN